MGSITFILLLLGGAGLFALFRRVRALEGEVAALHLRLTSIGRGPPTREEVRPEPVAAAPLAIPAELEGDRVLAQSPWTQPLDAPLEPAAVRDDAPGGFETLIGGRLPIWIGGAALILSGFFLVRYSIESGLLGPGVRTLLAMVFGLVLLAGGEAARRLPATRDDARIAQALTGAGIATLYGTLYMAGALYDLIGPLTAFLLLAAVTAAALGLSLRHGAPTAIMGLIGGFAAPLVTGFDGAALGPLLIYLALFTAALFGLAIHRGWLWLALAASGAALAWVNVILVTLGGSGAGLEGLGVFVLALATGAGFALPRAGAERASLRIAPIPAGLVQLLVLAPWLDFSPLAWGLYLLLSAAALWLGVRDPKLAAGGVVALGLVLVLLALALAGEGAGEGPGTAAWAAVAVTALFGGAGQTLSRRGTSWAVVAIGGTAGPVVLADLIAGALVPDSLWAGLLLAAAGAGAVLSWRHRDRIGVADPGLAGGAVVAALLAVMALAQLLPVTWLTAVFAVATIALALWARLVGDRTLLALSLAPLAGMLVAATPVLGAFATALLGSIAGQHLVFRALPELAGALRTVGLAGAVSVALLLAEPRLFGGVRRGVWAVAATLLLLTLYLLAKQVLTISTVEKFVALGFLERAIITQMLFAGGVALLIRAPAWRTLARALVVLALARFVWFDLVVANPNLVRQAVGSVPILNLATAHYGLTALWLWLLGRYEGGARWRAAALAFAAVAVGVTVRQAAQGTTLTGGMGRTENYLYSVAYLALAAAWLWRGIAGDSRSLRLAGLGLLTLVTLKVFLVDAAALQGVLRILSFLGLGLALMAIGWAYGRFLGRGARARGAR